jgi:hypothetical protein
MLEIGTSGLTSGDGKRHDRPAAGTRARPRLHSPPRTATGGDAGIGALLAGGRDGRMGSPFRAMPKPAIPLLISLAAVLMVCPAGCNRNRSRVDATIEEAPAKPIELTKVQANDPKAATQLIKGFYAVEQGSYRWTMGQFSATLRPPLHASERGAKLILNLGVPEPVIQKLKSIQLSASVDGVALPAETYTKPGGYVYSREVPAQALAKRVVTVSFALDKCLPPSDADRRELGVVVTAVGFESK